MKNSYKYVVCRYFIMVLSIILLLLFIAVSEMQTKTEGRNKHYIEAQQIPEILKENPEQIIELFQSRVSYYTEKISTFNSVVLITAALCILGLVAISFDYDISIPHLNINIPARFSYLVIASCLCYYWLRFGFLLHHIIEARMSLFNLIQAQYYIIEDDFVQCGDVNSYIYYYSLSRANDLKDTGFLDAWFLEFLPEYFPAPDKGFMVKLVPSACLVAYACLMGISHGLQLALPLNWSIKFRDGFLFIIAVVLLPVNYGFIVLSHYSFFFICLNFNWLQFVIIGVGILSFYIFTSKIFIKLYLNN